LQDNLLKNQRTQLPLDTMRQAVPAQFLLFVEVYGTDADSTGSWDNPVDARPSVQSNDVALMEYH
jgi:hypothetical protein